MSDGSSRWVRAHEGNGGGEVALELPRSSGWCGRGLERFDRGRDVARDEVGRSYGRERGWGRVVLSSLSDVGNRGEDGR